MIFTFTLVALHTVFQAVGVPQFTQGEESQGVLGGLPIELQKNPNKQNKAFREVT